MEYLFWFLIFAVLAVLATVPVHFHLASMRQSSGGTSPLPSGKTKPLRIENDYVFAFLGGSSPRSFLEKIGIPMVTKEVAMEGAVYG